MSPKKHSKYFLFFTSRQAVPDNFKIKSHHQSVDTLEHSNLCKIDHYQPIFGLLYGFDEIVLQGKIFMEKKS